MGPEGAGGSPPGRKGGHWAGQAALVATVFFCLPWTEPPGAKGAGQVGWQPELSGPASAFMTRHGLPSAHLVSSCCMQTPLDTGAAPLPPEPPTVTRRSGAHRLCTREHVALGCCRGRGCLESADGGGFAPDLRVPHRAETCPRSHQACVSGLCVLVCQAPDWDTHCPRH